MITKKRSMHLVRLYNKLVPKLTVRGVERDSKMLTSIRPSADAIARELNLHNLHNNAANGRVQLIPGDSIKS